MRSKKKLLILLLLLLAAVGIGIIFGQTTKTRKDAEVTIEEGSGSRDIARTLKREGVIGSEAAFLVRLKFSDYAGKLQYGTYEISKGMKLEELFEMLATQGAKENTINLTVPEGYTAEMIGDRLEKEGVCSQKDFLEAVSTKEGYDFSWLDEIKEKKGKKYILQGYLYPDTYNIYKTAQPKEIVTMMLANFEKHYQELGEMGDRSMDELVILASVIERETSVPQERSIIAGVMENRIQKGMRLQVDPTALYPLTDGMYNKKKVSYQDLKIDSPYNTNLNHGLPVGPICNPSIDCIKAAASPDKHEYLYYHTKSAGSEEHDFFRTYREHMDSQKH